MNTFLHNRVIGVPSSLTSPPPLAGALSRGIGPRTGRSGTTALANPEVGRESRLLPLGGALLVALPVFLQAPWVRLAPFSAVLFTAPLLMLALVIESRRDPQWQNFGALLVGFSGSWLGGCLFWGWCRLHPLWHLPIEAFALPLALGGLRGRWRLAASFYLASLLGTACTDAVMAITGVMGCWTTVLQAPIEQAPALLQQAALGVLQPLPLAVTLLTGLGLTALCRRTWSHQDPAWRVGASAVATTLAVDGLFLAAALWAPQLSGLI
ncbi:MAG: DUF3120 domain-containing protein [Vulcanococcus sp.]